MIIGIPVYQQVDLLDVAGPHEMFKWMSKPVADVRLIAETPGEITTRDGFTFKAPYGFDDIDTVDVLWVPGGDPGALKLLMSGPPAYLNFLIRMSTHARYVCSVCEGALLLAKAGLLDGFEATTHWYFIPCLKQFPNIKVVEGHPRFVVDRNRVTGGGISSGLDEALKLIELLGGYEQAQEVQRTTQYYPSPSVASVLPPVASCEFSFA
jgi:transcriptional regulator GlxA family with amidase domain